MSIQTTVTIGARNAPARAPPSTARHPLLLVAGGAGAQKALALSCVNPTAGHRFWTLAGSEWVSDFGRSPTPRRGAITLERGWLGSRRFLRIGGVAYPDFCDHLPLAVVWGELGMTIKNSDLRRQFMIIPAEYVALQNSSMPYTQPAQAQSALTRPASADKSPTPRRTHRCD